MAEAFLGEIRMFGFNFAPRGWTDCNGQIMPISSQQALFALIGNFYGGDGRTNFAVPNLQGRTPIHTGQGPGLQPYQLAQTVGQETVTLVPSHLPAHQHDIYCSTQTAVLSTPINNVIATKSKGRDTVNLFGINPVSEMKALGDAGGGLPHPNVPPGLAIRFCINLDGYFPSRN